MKEKVFTKLIDLLKDNTSDPDLILNILTCMELSPKNKDDYSTVRAYLDYFCTDGSISARNFYHLVKHPSLYDFLNHVNVNMGYFAIMLAWYAAYHYHLRLSSIPDLYSYGLLGEQKVFNNIISELIRCLSVFYGGV